MFLSSAPILDKEFSKVTKIGNTTRPKGKKGNN